MKSRILVKLASLALPAFTFFASLGSAPQTAHAAAWFNCVPTAIFEHSGDYEVSCRDASTTGVKWVAVTINTLTVDQRERFHSMATAALLSGRYFRVFASDTNCAVPVNDGPNACKVATSWSLYTPVP